MSDVEIRPEAPRDVDAIAGVVTRAFGSDAEARLVERIRASPEYVPELALVAVGEGAVVGHVMISGAILRSADGDVPIVMLSPLAVEPAWQGRGVGGALVRDVTGLASAMGFPFVVLEGSPAYYGRFGFVPAAAHGVSMPLPDWAPPEAAQLLPLASFTIESLRGGGEVVYPPAFDGLE